MALFNALNRQIFFHKIYTLFNKTIFCNIRYFQYPHILECAFMSVSAAAVLAWSRPSRESFLEADPYADFPMMSSSQRAESTEHCQSIEGRDCCAFPLC